MKINTLIKRLEKIATKNGNIDVLFSGPNMDTDLYLVDSVEFRVAKEDEFDPDWNMPAGKKFVALRN